MGVGVMRLIVLGAHNTRGACRGSCLQDLGSVAQGQQVTPPQRWLHPLLLPRPAHAGCIQEVALEERVRGAQLGAHKRVRGAALGDAAAIGRTAAARGGQLVDTVRGPHTIVVGAAKRARRGELRHNLERAG